MSESGDCYDLEFYEMKMQMRERERERPRFFLIKELYCLRIALIRIT